MKKCDTYCSECFTAVCTSSVLQDLALEVTTLVQLKVYRENSLVSCSALAFNLFSVCETTILTPMA